MTHCLHPFKAILGVSGQPHVIDWRCLTCNAEGATPWADAHHWERAEALMKHYEKVSPEMLMGENNG